MRVDDHDVQAFKWWICIGKNPLHSSLAVMTRVVCWMFQINRIFFHAVFPRSVNCWILFRPIAASGCHKKNCSTSTYFQYLSAKFVLIWFWPQPIARHETNIQKWLWPWLAARARRRFFFFLLCLWVPNGRPWFQAFQAETVKTEDEKSWRLSLYANESRNEHAVYLWLKWHIKLIMFAFWLFGNDVVFPESRSLIFV